MKVDCPLCQARQKVAEDLMDLPMPCRKCGQPFVASEVLHSAESAEIVETAEIIDEDIVLLNDGLTDSDFEVDDLDDSEGRFRQPDAPVANSDINLLRVSRGLGFMMLTYVGFCSSIVIFLFLTFITAVGQRDAPEIWIAVVRVALLGVIFCSGLSWIVALVLLKNGHPKGSHLRGLMSKSLKLAVIGVFLNIVGRAQAIWALSILGSLSMASAFDCFVGYFQHLCLELEEPELAERIRKLTVFYHRIVWVICFSILLSSFIPLPGAMKDVVVPLILFGCFIALVVFFIRFGFAIQEIRRLTQLLRKQQWGV